MLCSHLPGILGDTEHNTLLTVLLALGILPGTTYHLLVWPSLYETIL